MKERKILSFSEISSFAWHYVKEYPGKLVIALLGVLFMGFTEIATPIITGYLVDFLSENIADPQQIFGGAWIFVLLLMLAGIFFWTFKHTTWFSWAKIVASSMKKMNEDVLYKVQRFSTQWHQDSFAGAIVTKMKRGMRALQRFIDLIYYQFLPLLMVLIGMIITITLRYTIFGIIIGCGILLYSILSIALALKYVMPASREENRYDTLTGGVLADTISCNATVKAFANEKKEDTSFYNVMSGFKQASLQAWYKSEYTAIVQNVVMTLYKFLFIGGSVYLWARGIFSVGDFAFVLSGYQVISGHLRQIGKHIRELQQSASDMEDVVIFVQQPLGVEDRKGAKDLQVKKGEIIFDNIIFHYGDHRYPLFEDFSVHIKSGEKIALVGHSGSGKSTFVKLIQRLYDIQEGKILIDGQNISEVTIESLRKAIVLVPQEPILFHRTLADNISYGKKDASLDEIIFASKKAHAHEFIHKLPKQYDTYVGERGIKLSGGERQRVAIARAILANGPILILDEATSSLDSLSERYIQDAIDILVQNRTTIIIAHRLSTIKKVDRIIVFEEGKIVEEGTHQELLSHEKGIYKKLYEMQAGGFIGN